MEPQPISETPPLDHTSTVDTSRPFTSVKEAVAIFGERLLVGEIYSPKPFSDTPYSPIIKREPSWRFSSPSPNYPIKPKEENNVNALSDTAFSPPVKREPSWRFSSPSPIKPKEENNENALFDTLKKLEAELEKTKVELKMLKERGSETEVALATLNAELHKNMSKLAQAEAAAAGKAAVVATKTVRFEIERENGEKELNMIRGGEEEEKKRGNRRRMKETETLAEILSLGENDHLFGGKKVRKQKPIIPLVGDFFFKRKSSSTTNHHNPLYASPF